MRGVSTTDHVSYFHTTAVFSQMVNTSLGSSVTTACSYERVVQTVNLRVKGDAEKNIGRSRLRHVRGKVTIRECLTVSEDVDTCLRMFADTAIQKFHKGIAQQSWFAASEADLIDTTAT